MEFIKKHYEKLILSVVLVGLAGAVVFMVMKIKNTKQYLEDKRTEIIASEKKYKPISTAAHEAALGRSKTHNAVVLSGPHNTLNPVMWQVRLSDGKRIKVVTGTEVGPGAASVESITPLHFILSLEGISASSYNIGVTREAVTNKNEKVTTKRFYASLNSPKSVFFTLKEVKGPPENPTELICELADTKELASLAKDKPFKRVDAYTATVRYDVEARVFSKLRTGDTISFGGDEYVVEIKSDEVILSAKSSTKRTALKLKAVN